MIKTMYVKNFVLIDELQLDFHSSFSCFTGETGAGKSLFIDALSILCGTRVSSGFIQKGAEKALIEATIDISSNHPSYKVLEDAGFEIEDDFIIVSREFDINGKSIARINNRTTTVTLLKEIMSNIVDIHSQHDSQYLLNSKNHLGLLDRYIQNDQLCKDVNDTFKIYRNLQKELEAIQSEEYNIDDLEFYKYQLQEIESLDIQDGEVESLIASEKEMKSFEKTSEHLNNALHLFKNSNYENLYSAHKELEDIENSQVQEIKEEILNAYYILDEKIIELKEYTNSLEYDENVFNDIQSRLYAINKVIKKHGNSLDDLKAKEVEIQDKIKRFEDRDMYIEQKQKAIDEAYQVYYEKAEKLSDIRKLEAKKLELDIQKELADLHLANATFEIRFSEEVSKYGIDHVEFYIAMNKGEDSKPLAKVISGGELSRLMLGLKIIFSKLQDIQTIIFDEIDTGVSGNVAYAIGKKMKKLSLDAQVFSITHLAPVAAWGDYHYLVEKEEINERTISSIRILNEKERIEEMASIASNSNSDQALQAAKELYDSCRSDT